MFPVDTGRGAPQDGRMRENDDDAPAAGPQGSLADGLGETAEPGEYESSGDPYGETDFGDDDYGEDSYGADDTSGEDSYGTDDTSGEDSYGTDDTSGEDTYGTDDTSGTDGTFGDGDGSADEDDENDGDADADRDADEDLGATATDDGSILSGDDLLAQDNSPLEGIGFLIDEVREALFGEDDAAAASPFDTDPGDIGTDTDLDLTGDGLVDRADLHEAASSLDFDVSDGHHGHGHHDDGVMEA
jgi:hypothetical protein